MRQGARGAGGGRVGAGGGGAGRGGRRGERGEIERVRKGGLRGQAMLGASDQGGRRATGLGHAHVGAVVRGGGRDREEPIRQGDGRGGRGPAVGRIWAGLKKMAID